MNPYLKLKDVLNKEKRMIFHPRFSLVFIPLFFMAKLIDGVAKAQHMPAPLGWVGEDALVLYYAVYGTLSGLHVIEWLGVVSLFAVAIHYLYVTRRRMPLKIKKEIWHATFKAISAYLFDMMFIISVFFSASLNLLNVLAAPPDWFSTVVQLYGTGMLVFSILFTRIKRKIGLEVNDPTTSALDPIEIVETLFTRFRSLIKRSSPSPEWKKRRLLPCLVNKSTS